MFDSFMTVCRCVRRSDQSPMRRLEPPAGHTTRRGILSCRWRRPRGTLLATLLAIMASVMGAMSAGAVAGEPDGRSVQADQDQDQADQIERQQLAFFETHIRPLLIEHCYECHSGQTDSPAGALRVDSRRGLLSGGDSGPAVQPGDTADSLLMQSVRYESFEMPPRGKLSDQQLQHLHRWVAEGAFWPDEAEPDDDVAPAKSFDLQGRQAEHWAWQPLQVVQPPAVDEEAWSLSAIDRFIAAQRQADGLAFAAPVDRRTLIRRLSLDLLGLPPSPQQVADFVADESPDALPRLVDSLLQSPHFGERWARHWLDLVRYAETRGHEFDHDAVGAYQYRDYVIRALNADVPYDQFVREHLAGDLLPSPRLHPERQFNESILATGFWFLGETVHSPVDIRKDEADRFDNMIDVMTKTFLGLTVACARCHDHKFDAISAADYYALSGFLQSSEFRPVRFETIQQEQRIAAELAELDQHYQTLVDRCIEPHLPSETAAWRDSLAVGAWRSGASEPPVSRTAADGQSVDGLPVDGLLVDFAGWPADGSPSDWLQDGQIFGHGPVPRGTIGLDLSGDRPRWQVAARTAARNDRFWDGLQSISDKTVQQAGRLGGLQMSGRTLLSPTVTLPSGAVQMLVRGVGHAYACVDSHRLIAGPLHGQTVVRIDSPDRWTWVPMQLNRYAGHRVHFQWVPDPDQLLAVAAVADSMTDDDRRAMLQQATADDAAAETLRRWLEQPPSAELAEELQQLAERWADQRQQLRQTLPLKSQLAMAMMDISGEDDRLLIRGNASNPGDPVPRRYLSAIVGDQPIERTTSSGRLELAAAINDPGNPQASRVIVNRVWHYLMGRGIVATTDDFGVLGQPPTHPELLDYLADEFLRDGRSIKRLIRRIVLSQTYRMSGHYVPQSFQQDPKNLLWHYRPPKRLEAEAIRDSLLAISGRWQPELFGPSIPIHLTSFMEGRGRPGVNGPRDGAGRRSIYISVRRNFLSPFMLAFDSPVPFSTMGRRNVSNVPAQSLILMNSPMVLEQAQQWARATLARFPQPAPLPSHPASPTAAAPTDAVARSASAAMMLNQQRIDWMYQQAFARLPTPSEQQMVVDYLAEQTDGDRDEASLWTDIAHVLINTKEFIYLP